jgi:hypothetical protein
VCNTCGAFGNGIRLYAWAKGISLAKAESHILAWSGQPITEVTQYVGQKVDYPARLRRLNAVWDSAVPVSAGSPAFAYLRKRGLADLSGVALSPERIRWSPSLEQTHLGRRVSFPALILRISLPDGSLGSLHRIFLTGRGDKAPLDSPKKMMPGAAKLGGAAIRLLPAGPELLLAEGAETAWAGYLLAKGRLPAWACVSSTMLQSVQLPEVVRTVRILADLDKNKAGERAAEKLKERLESEGRTVHIHLPTLPIPEGAHKVDWLDVLNARQA